MGETEGMGGKWERLVRTRREYKLQMKGKGENKVKRRVRGKGRGFNVSHLDNRCQSYLQG
jgi:hypothetical protein